MINNNDWEDDFFNEIAPKETETIEELNVVADTSIEKSLDDFLEESRADSELGAFEKLPAFIEGIHTVTVMHANIGGYNNAYAPGTYSVGFSSKDYMKWWHMKLVGKGGKIIFANFKPIWNFVVSYLKDKGTPVQPLIGTQAVVIEKAIKIMVDTLLELKKDKTQFNIRIHVRDYKNAFGDQTAINIMNVSALDNK